MTTEIELNRFEVGISDYIPKMNQDNELLETYINLLLASLTGQSVSGLAVPQGLQQIFDRRGLIGEGSYDFAIGGSSLSVTAGAYWSGYSFFYKTTTTTLSMVGLPAGTYYLNLDATGTPLVSTTSDPSTSRQFSWNGSVTSAKAVYAGVSILFDGDDYADMLTSAARSKTFTKVADRLEEIEVILGSTVQTPTPADTINIDWSLGSHVRILLDRATTTINMSGGVDSRKYTLELIQDPVGGRAVVFGAEAAAGAEFTFPAPLSTDPDLADFLGFFYSDGNSKYNFVSIARGYPA
jgi:hypothetical protein